MFQAPPGSPGFPSTEGPVRVDRELAAALLRVNVPTIYHPKIVNVVEIDHDITKRSPKVNNLHDHECSGSLHKAMLEVALLEHTNHRVPRGQRSPVSHSREQQ